MMFERSLLRYCALVCSFALITSCEVQPTESERVQAQLLRESLPGITDQCVEKVLEQGVEALSADVRDCFAMQDARNWKGLWLNQFEGSRFCPEPATDCTFDTEGEKIWLSFSEGAEQGQLPDDTVGDQLYEIEFVGRLTTQPGNFGHQGGSNREIVVERLLKTRRVQ